jgi:2-dehydropantoate 2-reductase
MPHFTANLPDRSIGKVVAAPENCHVRDEFWDEDEHLMRVLVIGAGALGGYFGACMIRAGRDVTFLLRPLRAEQLAREGLHVNSPLGDFTVPAKTALAGAIRDPFDLILVGTKSYSLNAAMDDFADAVGATTAILPVLNGMAHLDTMSARFGAEHVLGGMAQISAALDPDGRVLHLFPHHELVFGEIAGGFSDRTRALSDLFKGSGFDARASDNIMQDMWEKWAGLCTMAGMNCLMRGAVGDILAAGGREAFLSLFDECRAVATAAGYKPRTAFVEFSKTLYTTAGSPYKASMFRDIERGSVTEGDHVLGGLVARARALGVATPILDLARIHVAAYEAGRAREAAAT